MSDDTKRIYTRRIIYITVAAAAVSGLLYALLQGAGSPRGRLSYGEVIAVVAVAGVTLAAALRARKRIRSQPGSVIETIPPQPGDTRTERAAPAAGRHNRKERVERAVARAPTEVGMLTNLIRGAAASPGFYEEKLQPMLERILVERAAERGIRIDPKTVLDIGPLVPDTTALRRLLLRWPPYRERVRLHAITTIVQRIQEI